MALAAGMNSGARTRRISASEGRGTGSGVLLMVVVAVAGGLFAGRRGCRGWSGKAAWVTARKARASVTVVTCRCQGVHLRTWYWVRPSRSLLWALFSSIFQRRPASLISSVTGVPSGAWERKNSISAGSVAERRMSTVCAWPGAGC